MNQTKHIDFTGGHFLGVSPVLFCENNLVVSFASREAAEAAIAGADARALYAIRLYDMHDKHSKGGANGS